MKQKTIKKMKYKWGAKQSRRLLTLFQEIGREIEHPFYRVVIYEDGHGEAEFETRNPVECLVFKWKDEAGLCEFLAPIHVARETFRKAVFRKKCTKCMMHERKQ